MVSDENLAKLVGETRMFGKAFGKRVVTPSSPAAAPGYVPAGPDPDGEMRIIPKAVWDGPNGAKLRQLGLSPDDPANLVLTPQRARALEDAATARMNAVVAKVNAHIPGVTVAPWAMIPWSVWEGPNAEFLIKSDFMPSSPWNNMLLAAMPNLRPSSDCPSIRGRRTRD